MTRTTGKKDKFWAVPLVALMLMSTAPDTVLAQDDLLISDTEDVLNNADIDIDGTFRRKSAADKIAEQRKKLERQTDDMMDKKIEDMRIEQEQKLTNKIKGAFQSGLNALDGDKVSTKSAAPVTKVEAPAPEEDDNLDVKVLPYFGVVNTSGDALDLESKFHGGLDFEANITSRISFGLGISYTRSDMTDYAQSANSGFGQNSFTPFYNNYYVPNYGYGFNNAYNSFYGNNYYNAFGSQGRVINYKNLGVNLNGKFFIIDNRRIRPYVGLGLTYNRQNLAYEDGGQNFNYQGFDLGNEEYASSFVAGSLAAGSEIRFTENIGMNLELRYTKGLTSSFNGQSANTFAFNPDQERLNQIGQAIQDANNFGLTAGVLITF